MARCYAHASCIRDNLVETVQFNGSATAEKVASGVISIFQGKEKRKGGGVRGVSLRG